MPAASSVSRRPSLPDARGVWFWPSVTPPPRRQCAWRVARNADRVRIQAERRLNVKAHGFPAPIRRAEWPGTYWINLRLAPGRQTDLTVVCS